MSGNVKSSEEYSGKTGKSEDSSADTQARQTHNEAALNQWFVLEGFAATARPAYSASSESEDAATACNLSVYKLDDDSTCLELGPVSPSSSNSDRVQPYDFTTSFRRDSNLSESVGSFAGSRPYASENGRLDTSYSAQKNGASQSPSDGHSSTSGNDFMQLPAFTRPRQLHEDAGDDQRDWWVDHVHGSTSRLTLKESVDGEVSDSYDLSVNFLSQRQHQSHDSGGSYNNTSSLLHDAASLTNEDLGWLSLTKSLYSNRDDAVNWVDLKPSSMQDISRPEPVGLAKSDCKSSSSNMAPAVGSYSTLRSEVVAPLLPGSSMGRQSSDMSLESAPSVSHVVDHEMPTDTTSAYQPTPAPAGGAVSPNGVSTFSPLRVSGKNQVESPTLALFGESQSSTFSGLSTGSYKEISLSKASISSPLETPVTKLLGPSFKDTEAFLRDLKASRAHRPHVRAPNYRNGRPSIGSSAASLSQGQQDSALSSDFKDESIQTGESKLHFSKISSVDDALYRSDEAGSDREHFTKDTMHLFERFADLKPADFDAGKFIATVEPAVENLGDLLEQDISSASQGSDELSSDGSEAFAVEKQRVSGNALLPPPPVAVAAAASASASALKYGISSFPGSDRTLSATEITVASEASQAFSGSLTPSLIGSAHVLSVSDSSRSAAHGFSSDSDNRVVGSSWTYGDNRARRSPSGVDVVTASRDMTSSPLATVPVPVVTHGIYDIRHSSGPGSTNRKRVYDGKPLRVKTSTAVDPLTVYVSEESKVSASSGRAPEHGRIQEEADGIKTQPIDIEYYRSVRGRPKSGAKDFLSSDIPSGLSSGSDVSASGRESVRFQKHTKNGQHASLRLHSFAGDRSENREADVSSSSDDRVAVSNRVRGLEKQALPRTGSSIIVQGRSVVSDSTAQSRLNSDGQALAETLQRQQIAERSPSSSTSRLGDSSASSSDVGVARSGKGMTSSPRTLNDLWVEFQKSFTPGKGPVPSPVVDKLGTLSKLLSGENDRHPSKTAKLPPNQTPAPASRAVVTRVAPEVSLRDDSFRRDSDKLPNAELKSRRVVHAPDSDHTTQGCPYCKRKDFGASFPTPCPSDSEQVTSRLALSAWTQTSPVPLGASNRVAAVARETLPAPAVSSVSVRSVPGASERNREGRRRSVERKQLINAKKPVLAQAPESRIHGGTAQHASLTSDTTDEAPAVTAWYQSFKSDSSAPTVVPLTKDEDDSLAGYERQLRSRLKSGTLTYKLGASPGLTLQQAFRLKKQDFIHRSTQRLQAVRDHCFQQAFTPWLEMQRLALDRESAKTRASNRFTKQAYPGLAWHVEKPRSLKVRSLPRKPRLEDDRSAHVLYREKVQQRASDIRRNRIRMKQYDLLTRERFLCPKRRARSARH